MARIFLESGTSYISVKHTSLNFFISHEFQISMIILDNYTTTKVDNGNEYESTDLINF